MTRYKHFLALAGACLAIVAAGVILYAGTLSAEFTSDDVLVTIENPLAVDASNIPHFFANDFDWLIPEELDDSVHQASRHGLYRPLLASSYTLDALLHGPEPFGWRLTNLVLHLVASLLVFSIAGRLLGSMLGGLAAALLFVAHPVHVEALASLLGGRAELLATVCVLGSWRLFLAGNDRSGPRRWLLDTASALVFLLGLFSKENAAMLPAILLLGGYCIDGKRIRDLLVRLVPHIVIFVLYASLRFVIVQRIAPNDWSQVFGPASAPETFGIVMFIMASYLRLVLVPYPLLHPDCFADLPERVSTWDSIYTFLLIGGLLALSVLGIVAGRRRAKAPVWAFSILLFFVCLVPVSHIIPFRVLMATRFLYLPSVAFCLLAGGLAVEAWKHYPRILAIGGSLVLAAYVAGTLAGNRSWSDLDRLYQGLLECNPDSADAYNNMGTSRLRKGRPQEALALFLQATKAAPEMSDPLYNIGLAQQKLGRSAEAENAYRKALARDPSHAMAANNLGTLLQARGDLAAARQLFEQALEADPSHPAAMANLGSLYQRAGKPEEAESMFRLALKIDPRLVGTRFNLARLLVDTGRSAEGERLYREIIGSRPQHAMAHNNLANLLKGRKQWVQARYHYDLALLNDPACVPAHFNLANLLMLRGEPQEAGEHYRTAVGLDTDHVRAWIGLAYARLELGDLQGAAQAAARAAALAPDDERVDKIKKRLGTPSR